MKLSESWLREWVNPNLTRIDLCNKLTMAGLEVEELAPVAEKFNGVVVGKIIELAKHPDADQLTICKVDIGKTDPLTIVCGALNLELSMRVAVATVAAILPNKKIISQTCIRGVDSYGMLCSAAELKLGENGEGVLKLSSDAPIGIDIWGYLKLSDYTIDLSITPNRGDCLSVRGVARDISALTDTHLTPIVVPESEPTLQAIIPVEVEAQEACPRYVGRIIRNIKSAACTPTWLKECLRRSGIRSIHPIVDVTNYVMLELGQPMHAFDLDKIDTGITVRYAKTDEKIALLDGSQITLNKQTLLIADNQSPLAIAGVMGGIDSSVTQGTEHIFLESAYFSAEVVARQRQFYHLTSDSAYRFERGVDYTIQSEALERATQLISAIAGGEVGPIIEVVNQASLPTSGVIELTAEKIFKVLGVNISEQIIDKIFDALNFTWTREASNWQVTPPAYRYDVTIPEDLIEEIARLYGYNKIPTRYLRAALNSQDKNSNLDFAALRRALSSQGYHEIISYSFVDSRHQALFDPDIIALPVLNPITAEMAVMRTTLWPGLISTLLYNRSRQQQRVRLFEIGTVFQTDNHQIRETTKLGGLITGLTHETQWGVADKECDFFDLKGDLQNVLSTVLPKNNYEFRVQTHPALHPGQSAAIYFNKKMIGLCGAIHPRLSQSLDLTTKTFVFELNLIEILNFEQINYHLTPISKFPEIRRDVAILVNQAIPAKAIQDTIKVIAGDWLKDIFIFDVYQGKGISSGLKSIALALILQHPTRTLVDIEVSELMDTIFKALQEQLGATLRS